MRMKKITGKVVSMLLTVIMMVSTVCYSVPEMYIRLVVGGEEIETNVGAVLFNDRTMVPFKTVFDSIGAKINYDDNSKSVTAVKNGTTVKLTVGSDVMIVNDKEKKMDAPVIIDNERIYVPVRACAQAFGMEVEWIDGADIVKIKKQVSLPLKMSGNDGYWCNYTYDDCGNMIYSEDSTGQWEKLSYNEFGSIIESESSIGYWYKNTYNDKGIIASSEAIGDDVSCVEYDERGNIICSSGEFIDRYEYDAFNNLIRDEVCAPDGTTWVTKYKYDKNGNCIYMEGPEHWERYKYDESGKHIMTETSYGSWEKSTYDENGNLICEEHSEGGYCKYEYDENGNCIYMEMPSAAGGTYWIKYFYDENGNLKETVDSRNFKTEYVVMLK